MRNVVIIVIVVLLAIGLVTAKLSGGKKEITEAKPAEETTKTISGEVSLDAALASGQDFFCTFKEKDSNDAGTIFVADNKFRADFESETGGTKTQTHMAFDGEWYYIWMTSGAPFKMKADLVKSGETKQSLQEAVKKSINPGTKTEIICMPWKKNEEALALPQAVEFTDLSTMMTNRVSPAPATGSATGE